jgi:hypothetical protein
MSARKLPRAKGSKAPSLRDRLIYRQVTVGCRLQCAVAKEFALCEGQVSRIVKRVKEWLGTQTRMERGELPHVAEQRVGRWLAIARAEEMYAEARRLVEEAGGERSGQKTEDRGQGTEDRGQRTEAGDARRMSVRLQAIKTALKASQEAYELSQSPPPPEPDPATDGWAQTLLLRQGLLALRQAAEDEGRVVKSRCVPTLIEVLLELLVGNSPGIFPAGHRGPGTEYWELAAALVGSDGNVVQPDAGCVSGAQHTTSDAAPDAVHFGRGGLMHPTQDAQGRNFPGTDYPLDAPGRFYDASLDPYLSCGASSAAAARAEAAEVAREKTEEVAQSCRVGPARAASAGPPATGADWQRDGGPAAAAAWSHPTPTPKSNEPPEVGSPEWQVARAKWLAEREQRRVDALRWKAAEQNAKYLEERERMERVRARNRWLE